MPLIGDFKQKKTKKFVKKEYRPWDEAIPQAPFKEAHQNIEDEVKREEIPFNSDLLPSFVTADLTIGSKENLSLSSVSHHPLGGYPASSIFNEKKRETTCGIGSEENQTLNLEKYARGLYGLQRGLLQIIIENISCCEQGFAISKPLSGNDLSLSLKAPINSIKGSLQRLIKAKIIDIHDFKPGRGGYSCYKVTEPNMIFFKNYFKG